MRSLAGSVYKTKDGRWFARVQYLDRDGNRRHKRRIVLSRRLAEMEVRNLRGEIDRELSDRKTYRDLDRFFRTEYVHVARFVDGRKLSGYRQPLGVIENYLDAALHFLADRPLEEIGYSDLQTYKRQIAETLTVHGRRRSIADINHHLKWLRRLLNVAVEQGWLAANPFKRGRPLIIESLETERTRILSLDEEKRLLAACEPRRRHLVPVLIVAIETGLRRGELTSLTWFDVNAQGRFLTVRAANAKTLKSRLVPLSARAVDTLAQLRRNSTRRDSAAVFGRSDFKKAFLGACRDAGLTDLTFHDLRHTAITRWLEKGISPALAMKASGHSQTKTFMRYVNQSEKSIAEFARVISQAA